MRDLGLMVETEPMDLVDPEADAFAQELDQVQCPVVARAALANAFVRSAPTAPAGTGLVFPAGAQEKTARCATTAALLDAYHACHGLSTLRHDWELDSLIERERVELKHAYAGRAPVDGSLPPRRLALVVLALPPLVPSTLAGVLDAAAFLAGVPHPALDNACLASEARVSFLAGATAVRWKREYKAAIVGDALPKSGSYQVAVLWGGTGGGTGGEDGGGDGFVSLSAALAPLAAGKTAFSTAEAIRLAAAETCAAHAVVAPGALCACLDPSSSLADPKPEEEDAPPTLAEAADGAYLRLRVSAANEFFGLLFPPAVFRPSAHVCGLESTRAVFEFNDVFVRVVPKKLAPTDDLAVSGLLVHAQSRAHDAAEYCREAMRREQQEQRGAVCYGIGPPQTPRERQIGLHVLSAYTERVDLGDRVTTYGLLSAPGERLHTAHGSSAFRIVNALLSVEELVETAFVLPCSRQSCYPVAESLRQPLFSLLGDAVKDFAPHFHADGPETPGPSAWARVVYEDARPPSSEADAFVLTGFGLGFDSRSSRVGDASADLASRQAPEGTRLFFQQLCLRYGNACPVAEALRRAAEDLEASDRTAREKERIIEELREEVCLARGAEAELTEEVRLGAAPAPLTRPQRAGLLRAFGLPFPPERIRIDKSVTKRILRAFELAVGQKLGEARLPSEAGPAWDLFAAAALHAQQAASASRLFLLRERGDETTLLYAVGEVEVAPCSVGDALQAESALAVGIDEENMRVPAVPRARPFLGRGLVRRRGGLRHAKEERAVVRYAPRSGAEEARHAHDAAVRVELLRGVGVHQTVVHGLARGGSKVAEAHLPPARVDQRGKLPVRRVEVANDRVQAEGPARVGGAPAREGKVGAEGGRVGVLARETSYLHVRFRSLPAAGPRREVTEGDNHGRVEARHLRREGAGRVVVARLVGRADRDDSRGRLGHEDVHLLPWVGPARAGAGPREDGARRAPPHRGHEGVDARARLRGHLLQEDEVVLRQLGGRLLPVRLLPLLGRVVGQLLRVPRHQGEGRLRHEEGRSRRLRVSGGGRRLLDQGGSRRRVGARRLSWPRRGRPRRLAALRGARRGGACSTGLPPPP